MIAKDNIIECVLKHNPTHMIEVNPETFEITDEVRRACEVNTCGKYNKNWYCPPHTGTVSECQNTIFAFSNGILVQNVYNIEDSWDFEGMSDAGNNHNNMMREIRDILREKDADAKIEVYSAGGCNFCKKCTCPDAECRFPGKGMYSIEGMGVNVYHLVEKNGLKYINGVNTVSYVGVILF